jgi:prepilin-type N-terminal cleavage/methylation domain-containing protein
VTEAAPTIHPATPVADSPAARRSSTRASRAVRRGFTLLELLIVMAIMLVLISMLFLGLKYVTKNVKTKDTKTALTTLNTMFTNYEQATHLSPNGPAPASSGLSPSSPAWSGYIAAPGAITPDTAGVGSLALPQYTESVMYLLLTIPDNKKIMDTLPSNKKSNVLGATPVLLDGWGEPILFVPGYPGGNSPWGLSGVTTAAGSNQYITSPDKRPFWVSAGPDGNVALGDDNIYSFQN